MQINSLNSSSTVFLNKQSTKKEKYENIMKKRAYVESKTKVWEDLVDVCFIATLGTGILDVGLLPKDQKHKKLTIGFLIATLALFITKCVKQIQASNKYDREVIH